MKLKLHHPMRHFRSLFKITPCSECKFGIAALSYNILLHGYQTLGVCLPPPLGYDVVDRKLVINSQEAKLVGHIFERFLALGSVTMLISELNRDGYTTKSYISRTNNPVGGKPFTMNTILTLLRNRLLVGDVHHKGKYYRCQRK